MPVCGPERAFDRPGRAKHLECREAEPVGLILQQDLVHAEVGCQVVKLADRSRRVPGQ